MPEEKILTEKESLELITSMIICWVCSIASYNINFTNGLLLMALSATSAWLIPGIILRRRYLKLKNV